MIEDLKESTVFQKLEACLSKPQALLIEGLWDAPKALLLAHMQARTGKSILVVTGGAQEESRLYDDLKYFSKVPVLEFPAWETLPQEDLAPSPDIVGERFRVLRELSDGGPGIVLSPLQACLQKVLTPKRYDELYLELKKGQVIPFEELIHRLEALGYQRSSVAADKGEFAVRGGIIDVFPVSSPDPYRLEFWGDDLESLRTYDPVAQTSVGEREFLALTPAIEKELIRQELELASLLDYIGDDCFVVLDDLAAIEDRIVSFSRSGEVFSKTFSTLEDFLGAISNERRVYWTAQSVDDLSPVSYAKGRKKLTFECFGMSLSAERCAHPFVPVSDFILPGLPYDAVGEELLMGMGQILQKDCRLRLLCQSEMEMTYLQERFKELSVELPADTAYQTGYLSSGFALQEQAYVLVPMAEITQQYKVRRQKQRSAYHTVPSELYELIPGDAVAHLHHGIGIYRGVEKRPNAAGLETEYFLLEYADNSRLFVPLTQSHLISKYVGRGDECPLLHTIGAGRWKRAKAKTETAIMGYATDLLRLYATREMQEGFSCPQDGAEVQRFELEFPYVESEDQLSAITDVKEDMCSIKAMDRLVCGDVGYGKTEVAMRAAFKMVLNGCKQVAVLVPTTVLAMQHYETFCARMRHYPVNISVMSRFRSPKQMREALEGVRQGSVDILIGTHRIVSKDVSFKDLGLVIIDEEQRFGVKAKEHLKKLRSNVECLTLSATPIPRTLHMSLVGARDLSVINTPPDDRLPIQTQVVEENDAVIKNALLRELTRDGQAFVIHNRVATIHQYAERIRKMVPHARVVIGHGQMAAAELDAVFHAFKSGEADILISTTIVENGVDIPNANTMIVDRADRFGLAELYQLRGRVGRWNRRAYAYFLVPRNRSLAEHAQKRLEALVDSSGRGGGMRIAMRDLEIRGAGDILGIEQSGHVAAVGFHLYCKLLKRTIDTLTGKVPSTICDTKLEFVTDARLPESYVNDSSLRMEIYQRFGEAATWDQVDTIYRELKDRFGQAPEPVKWLYHLMRIRVYASLNSFTVVKIDKVSLQAERKKGPESIQKKVLLKKCRNPANLEAEVLKLLKKHW